MNQNVKLDKEKETALVYGLSHDGRGIAAINHKTTFISGTLPDEIITYKFTQKRSAYNEAKVIEILKPSPKRTQPPCQHFDICGGCSLQHMSSDMQIQLKEKTLLEQLKHFGQIVPQKILPPLNAENLGYRRKARLGVKFVIKKNKLLMGFHEKSSSFLADLEQCIVLHPRFNIHYDSLKKLIASLEHYQFIPQIEMSMGDEKLALVFRHLKNLSDNDRQKLMIFAQEHRIDIYLQPNPPAPIQKLWPEDNDHFLSYSLPDYHLEFLFHPTDFTQVNLEINRLMINQALTLLDIKAEDNILDLFCGIGNFTLPIARFANHVTGIEGTTEMTIRAKKNALHNNIHNVTFHAANLMEPVDAAGWAALRYNKILLDPPRAGAKEILTLVPVWQPEKIVYVSCNPATLARDAGVLVHQYGYELTQVGTMNMFPHTSHIEAMAVFEKKRMYYG